MLGPERKPDFAPPRGEPRIRRRSPHTSKEFGKTVLLNIKPGIWSAMPSLVAGSFPPPSSPRAAAARMFKATNHLGSPPPLLPRGGRKRECPAPPSCCFPPPPCSRCNLALP